MSHFYFFLHLALIFYNQNNLLVWKVYSNLKHLSKAQLWIALEGDSSLSVVLAGRSAQQKSMMGGCRKIFLQIEWIIECNILPDAAQYLLSAIFFWLGFYAAPKLIFPIIRSAILIHLFVQLWAEGMGEKRKVCERKFMQNMQKHSRDCGGVLKLGVSDTPYLSMHKSKEKHLQGTASITMIWWEWIGCGLNIWSRKKRSTFIEIYEKMQILTG